MCGAKTFDEKDEKRADAILLKKRREPSVTIKEVQIPRLLSFDFESLYPLKHPIKAARIKRASFVPNVIMLLQVRVTIMDNRARTNAGIISREYT